MIWRYWLRLNVTAGWLIVWFCDVLIALSSWSKFGVVYRNARAESNAALSAIWNGKEVGRDRTN